MPDEPTEPVQPEEGQGGGGQGGDPPYADYLNSIPEDLRPQVEPAFQKWDADVTRKFQEGAEYRQSWEPYEQFREQLGAPEHVQELLQLRDILVGDPQQAQQWWQSYAQERGLTPAEQAQQAQVEQPGSEDWMLSEDDRLAKLLDERISPLQEKLSQYDQRWEQQELQARQVEWEEHFDGQLAGLKSKHPDDFAIKDEKGAPLAEEYINRFAGHYLESDPHHAVERGFEDWQRLRGQLEKTVLTQKAGVPPPAEGGGVPASAPEDVHGLSQAGDVLLERLRAANNA